MLIIEAAVLFACCICASMTVTAMFGKQDFLGTYRAVCTSALTVAGLFLSTKIAQQFCLEQKNARYRIANISGGIIVLIVTASLTAWLFGTPDEARIKTSAYLNLWSWLLVLPVMIAAALFFKLPEETNQPQ